MAEDAKKQFLDWCRELQALAQAGLHYSQDVYDRERFARIREIAAEMLAFQNDFSAEKVKADFLLDEGYQTPKLDCRAAVIEDGKILLVRENNGLWAMPGGWVDQDTTIAESTVKECKEEAGLDVRCLRLVAVQDREKHNRPPHVFPILKAFVLCERLGGRFRPNSETTASGWFSPDHLPPLCLDKTTASQIALCLEAAAAEHWETRLE